MTEDLLARRFDPPALTIDRYPWSYSLVDDELVDISWRGVRLLSGVRIVVRDRDWQTVPTQVRSTRVTGNDANLNLTADIEAIGFGIEFTIELRVGVSPESLTAEFTGTADAQFMSNRIGFVVLHPRRAQGEPVTVEHPDGGTTRSAFPELISPHQPFMEVSGLRWQVDGIEAHLAFEGDTFETEDQRNWTDASFKTYSRPLELPFPFAVEKEDVFSQRLVLTANPPVDIKRPRPSDPTDRVVIDAISNRHVPEITSMGWGNGLEASLVELDLSQPRWEASLNEALRQTEGLKLDLRLVAEEPDSASRAIDRLEGVATLSRIAMFDKSSHMTELEHWQWLGEQRGRLEPSVALIAGTRAHFTELNRSHGRLSDVLRAADGITFSLTPQMHSTEVRHIVSSLQAQEDVAASANEIVGFKPIHVGPITLGTRFNAVATTSQGRDVQAGSDPLTRTPFAAAWMIGSISALSRDGVASLSYFRIDELSGTAAARLLTELTRLRGLPILNASVSLPDDLAVLPVNTEGGAVVFVANLSRYARNIEIESPAEERRGVELEPWSHQRIDFRPAVS